MWLVRVTLPPDPKRKQGLACFGFVVNADGYVVEAAPMAKWAVEQKKRGRDVVIYYRGRRAEVEIFPIKQG
ncbi:MAG TPA: hypothetical protein VH593_06145 [Ktedonobacteraceae bacterium]|jgi:hypothetical protein